MATIGLHTRTHTHTCRKAEGEVENRKKVTKFQPCAVREWKWHPFSFQLFPLQNENCLFKERRDREKEPPFAFMLKFYKTPDYIHFFFAFPIQFNSVLALLSLFLHSSIFFVPSLLLPASVHLPLSPLPSLPIFTEPSRSSTPASFLFLTYHFILTK